MLPIRLEPHGGNLDAGTGYQALRMEFRFPSDPECFHGFLGEQVQPCVYRPSRVLLDNYLVGMGDELTEPDPETFEISNICEAEEGLEAVRVGYSFRLRFQWRDRYADLF